MRTTIAKTWRFSLLRELTNKIGYVVDEYENLILWFSNTYPVHRESVPWLIAPMFCAETHVMSQEDSFSTDTVYLIIFGEEVRIMMVKLFYHQNLPLMNSITLGDFRKWFLKGLFACCARSPLTNPCVATVASTAAYYDTQNIAVNSSLDFGVENLHILTRWRNGISLRW